MRLSNNHRGFTLPAVLVVVAALLILAVGALLVVGIERDTARSFVDRKRAELAARAGLEDIRGILTAETANDDFVVLQSALSAPITPGGDPAPHLFIGRGTPQVSNDVFNYRYIPLFSTTTRPADSPFTAPELGPLTEADPNQRIDFTTLPYHDKVRAAWLPVQDENGRTVARYAYWVEDLQSRVDPAIAGNDKGPGGTHARVAWPFPAPGLNDRPDADDEPALDQIALFALDPAATDAAQGDLGKTLRNNRKLLVSPDSQLAAAGIQPPLVRLTSASNDAFAGDLTDPRAGAAERGLVAGIRPYLERPLVPYSAGIHPAAAGQPKLNLNKLLAGDRPSAVDEMADFIRKALPQYDAEDKQGRKGGFPDDYLKTLAANALDYADSDNDATIGTGYRGIDGYPLVSEFVFKSRWENIRIENGRKFLVLSVSIYVELWNMSNVPVDGRAQVSYETKYGFQIPPNPNFFTLDDLSRAAHNLTESDGYRWFPDFSVTLQPNEYRVFKCGTVTYTYDAVSSSEFIASPLILSGESYAARGAGYRMRWNGEIVDQSRGGVHRNDSSLNYPSDTKNNPRQRVRTTIPGHSHWRGVTAPRDNNMGDARMSHYLLSPQDANVYPQNYSPNRRNIREGSVYNSNVNFVYGRVLPSEWPDGGHDSPFGSNNVYSLVGMSASAFDDDHRIEPDAPGFFNQLPDLSLGREEAPTRLSNLGRFLSVTELGRIYDPVMWRVRTSTTNNAGIPWGDVLTSSTSSTDHGGGNTLRIGRPEHPAFDVPGLRASHLLDLFHAGLSRSDDNAEREGPLVKIAGHLNLNTASKPALRQLIAGRLGQDPEIRRFLNNTHSGGRNRFPLMQKLTPAPDITTIAGRIADAVIRSRPYASTGELANAREVSGTTVTPVFGNPQIIAGFTGNSYPYLQWTDSAAEETFARTHEAATIRSRNFRIWVVGQSIAPTTSTTAAPEVLAEVRKAFTVFADPGKRLSDGSIDPTKFRLKIIHENDF
jgi:type II secretory pathway pseudopilin PulG